MEPPLGVVVMETRAVLEVLHDIVVFVHVDLFSVLLVVFFVVGAMKVEKVTILLMKMVLPARVLSLDLEY